MKRLQIVLVDNYALSSYDDLARLMNEWRAKILREEYS
jgi:hypothetical protein